MFIWSLSLSCSRALPGSLASLLTPRSLRFPGEANPESPVPSVLLRPLLSSLSLCADPRYVPRRILAATLPEGGSLRSVCRSRSSLLVVACSWPCSFLFFSTCSFPSFRYDLSFLLPRGSSLLLGTLFLPAIGPLFSTPCGSALLPAVGPFFFLLPFTSTIQLVVLVLRLLRPSVDAILFPRTNLRAFCLRGQSSPPMSRDLCFELCPVPGVAILRVRQSRAARRRTHTTCAM